MTKLDREFYKFMKRNMTGDEDKVNRPDFLQVRNVTCKLVTDEKGKLCFSWKSPDVKYEVYKTDPIVSIEKLEKGCRIVTFCGMIYLLEEE